MRETIVDDEVGWLVQRDAALFARKLESLLVDEKLRQRMGQSGIAYVRQNWTWQNAVDRLEDEFKQEGAS
jgi:glycosyltransferase involved in cell wall biosynthesis